MYSDGFTTGYGTDVHLARRNCFQCCGEVDCASMIKRGRIALYLTHPAQKYIGHPGRGMVINARVTNWPGTLEFHPSYVRTGKHNMAGRRYDVWFRGPDGRNWHGVTYDNNTQLCHCRRLAA